MVTLWAEEPVYTRPDEFINCDSSHPPMQMRENALDEILATRPLKATRKIIDHQTKIIREIMDADGEATWF